MGERFTISIKRILVLFAIAGWHSLFAQNSTWLRDATEKAGLDGIKADRIYAADVNNDDYPDLLLHYGLFERNALKLYLNIPDPSSGDTTQRVFRDFTAESGINVNPDPDSSGRQADNAVLGDVDNDGDVDLITCIYYHRKENYNDRGDRCECLLNDGKGHFTIRENNGLHKLGLINTTGLSLLDYNLDGNIDLYMGTWSKDHTNNIFMHDILMEGKGDGTFKDVSREAELTKPAPKPAYGTNMMDWNNDKYPDIAMSPYCKSGGKFWKNNGNGTFEDVSADIGYNALKKQGDNGQNICQWAAQPSDFDNDGDIDFYLCFVHGGRDPGEGKSTLVINKGPDSNFVTRWAPERVQKEFPKPPHYGDFDAEWMDIDNDGLVDLVTGQGTYNPGVDRLYIFQQGADHYFVEITNEVMDLFEKKYKQPNVVQSLDFDLDGDDDLLFQSTANEDKLTLFRNDIGHKNEWLSVKLIPPEGINRSGIGARIYVYAGDLARMRTIYAGEGNFGGQRPFILNFGLEQRDVDSVRVRWPGEDQEDTTLYNAEAEKMLVINARKKPEKDTIPDIVAADFEVFPNPVKDVLHFKITEGTVDGKLEIFNHVGQPMESRQFLPEKKIYEINVSRYSAGLYVIRITLENGFAKSFRFIKGN